MDRRLPDRIRLHFFASLAALLLFAACQPSPQRTTPSAVPAVKTPAATSPAQPAFAPGVNPLTGQLVADPSLLKIPALLVSISHFPATARPQSGLSFAPFVYEFYITEGATRFLAVFYGEFPQPEVPPTGGCETRTGPFSQTATLIGNRVWLDTNQNGLQDPGEGGISGLCVNLYDARGNLVQRASTDSNGYYGFNVQPGKYDVEFVQPKSLDFTRKDVGEDSADSDADAGSGRTTVQVKADDLTVDAGLLPAAGSAAATDSSQLPLPQVGPVRSGRLIYSYIAKYFDKSCLIYAFASEEVLARLPQCHMVFHQLVGGGYMLGLDEMRSVAQQTMQENGSDFDYSGNAFSDAPPAGGTPASLLKVYFAYQNQSGWAYDPISQAYLRYVDTAEYDQAGILHPDTDRLTGRQLQFQNVIVLYARHEVISPTNLDIHLGQGKSGPAVLFRNGRMFKITWSVPPAQDVRVRPIQFLSGAGQPVALEPGHTWVIVVTPDSPLDEFSPGQWRLAFSQPPGAK